MKLATLEQSIALIPSFTAGEFAKRFAKWGNMDRSTLDPALVQKADAAFAKRRAELESDAEIDDALAGNALAAAEAQVATQPAKVSVEEYTERIGSARTMAEYNAVTQLFKLVDMTAAERKELIHLSTARRAILEAK